MDGHPFANNTWTQVNNKYFHWLFTHYDVSEENQKKLIDLQLNGHCQYIIIGREICPTTGNKHLQGFVSFKNQVRRSSLIKLLGECFVKPMITKGSTDDCINYCKKDGDFTEIGEPVLTSKRAKGMLDILDDIANLIGESEWDTQYKDVLSIVCDAIDELYEDATHIALYFAPDDDDLQCETDDDMDDDIDDDIDDDAPVGVKRKRTCIDFNY